MLLPWVVVFIISLAVLLFAADFFTKGAEMAGLKLKISPFIVGVTIVSIGTSLPELVTSLIAIASGETGIPVANAIGSNIANILLVVGVCAAAVKSLSVDRSLIDLDAPLLAISTGILIAILMDKQVTFVEAVILVLTYLIYVAYTIRTSEDPDNVVRDNKKVKKNVKKRLKKEDQSSSTFTWKAIFVRLIVGSVLIYFSADYTIQSVTEIGLMLKIAPSIVAITAIAIGTSLPELIVSIGAAKKGAYEVALGNVFGSNIFNALMVIGVPGLFTTLPVDAVAYEFGILFLVLATVLYIFSGISKKIHRWEGLMYLMLYILFISKIIGA